MLGRERNVFPGFQVIDGKWGDSNETTSRPGVNDGKPARVVCSVGERGLSLRFDGKKLTGFKGGYDHLSNIPELSPKSTRVVSGRV